MCKSLWISCLVSLILLILAGNANANLQCYTCNDCEEDFPFAEKTCEDSQTTCLKVTQFKSQEEKNDGIVSFTWRGCSTFPLGCKDDTIAGSIRTRCGCEGDFCNGSNQMGKSAGFIVLLASVCSLWCTLPLME